LAVIVLDLKDIQVLPEELNKVMEESVKRGMRDVLKWLGTQIARQLAQKEQIKTKVAKKRVFIDKLQRSKELMQGKKARVWIGLDPVDASGAKKVNQLSGGVLAGGHYFPSAFYEAVFGDVKGIYRRTGSERFPVIRERIPLGDDIDIDQFAKEAQNRLSDRINFWIGRLLR